MVRLEQIRHATLAGLGVHTDDRLVGASNILRIDRQIRHQPYELVQIGTSTIGGHLTSLKALLNGVLMGTGERGEHEVARIGVTLGDLDLIAVFDGLANLRNIRVVDLRIDALGQEIQAKRDQIDVAGALAIAQQAALHTVGAGQHRKLGCGDAHTFVVMRVQGQHDGVAVVEVVGHVFDLVREHVRSGHFDGGR